MPYFEQFPRVDYDYKRDGVIQKSVDLFRQVRPLQNFVDNVSSYKLYDVPNGQRPDICSLQLYGTPDFYWTFFVVNEFLHDGMTVWPMSPENLFDYINTEYRGIAIETRPNVVRNTDGGITDFRDSLAGRFEVGEKVYGGTSGAAGTLVKKDLYLNQLVIQDIVNGVTGQNPQEVAIIKTAAVSSYDSGTNKTTIPLRSTDPDIVPNQVLVRGTDGAGNSVITNTFSTGGVTYTGAQIVNQITGKNLIINGNHPIGNGQELFFYQINNGITGGPFIGDGVGNNREAITGATSTDSITSWKVYNYSEAPHHWFVDGDPQEIQVSNANFFSVTDNASINEIIQVGSVASPTFTSNRNYLFDLNEQRSRIRIVDPNYIQKFAREFETVING